MRPSSAGRWLRLGGRLAIGMILTLALTIASLAVGQGRATAASAAETGVPVASQGAEPTLSSQAVAQTTSQTAGLTTEDLPAPSESDGAEPTAGLAVSAGVSDSIVRLYLAVFDRDPDAEGQEYWVGQYVDGVRLTRIVESFMSSQEWQRHIGTLTDAEFVALLYSNVLNRAPDPDGEQYWLAQVAAGLSRTDMLLWFSEGDEFVRLTGTATPEPPPPAAFPAIPADSGTGRRIVYANSDQRVWVVEDGGLIHDSYLVSGRAGVPNPGVYQVYSKSELAYAGHDGITMKHMVRFAWGARLSIGFHAIPRYAGGTPMQTEDQLGTYQSAGCVRQADHQAEALYHWARIGDTVVVLP